MSSYAERAIAAFERLETENAKLQERIHKLEMEGSDYFYRMAYAEDANRTLEAENTKLQDENAKLRELLVGAFEDMNAWQAVIAGSNEWGYGKGCLECLCKLRDAMQELGMKVVI